MTTRNRIASLLRGTPDGLEATKIAAQLGMTDGQVRTSAHRCLNIYIDRWAPRSIPTGPHLVAVYCYTDVPTEDCPRPDTPPKARKRRAA